MDKDDEQLVWFECGMCYLKWTLTPGPDTQIIRCPKCDNAGQQLLAKAEHVSGC